MRNTNEGEIQLNIKSKTEDRDQIELSLTKWNMLLFYGVMHSKHRSIFINQK